MEETQSYGKPPAPTENLLKNYYRQPKVYIKLPSKGKFYPAGSLDVSETGDYAVYAMTAKDELMFKTPDALMSGQATVEVIKSCVPSILNPWNMPSIDMDAVLIAIRIATYGGTMGITAECPACKEENEYEFNLVSYIENLSNIKYVQEINVDPLIVYIRPYTYKEVTSLSIKASEQEKIFNIINNDELSEEEKIEMFAASFVKLTDLTIGLISKAIVKIVTPEGDVTDPNQIDGFIANASKDVFKTIKDHLEKMAEQFDFKPNDVKCGECEHQYSTVVTMDKSNFFDVRS